MNSIPFILMIHIIHFKGFTSTKGMGQNQIRKHSSRIEKPPEKLSRINGLDFYGLVGTLSTELSLPQHNGRYRNANE